MKLEFNTFEFDQLSDEAKENALRKLRGINVDEGWWDTTYEDVRNVAEILGIKIDNIYFSGYTLATEFDSSKCYKCEAKYVCYTVSTFSSQGDGAQFVGDYSYNVGCIKDIKEHAPKDITLHDIATQLYELQKHHNYKLYAVVTSKGNYSHEHCTHITVYKESEYVADIIEDSLAEILRSFMRWIYKQLRQEFEHLVTDEAIIETIEANEYMFFEDGSRTKTITAE